MINNDTTALVRQLRDALIEAWPVIPRGYRLDRARNAIDAADKWLATPPVTAGHPEAVAAWLYTNPLSGDQHASTDAPDTHVDADDSVVMEFEPLYTWPRTEPAEPTYAYSIDGGETYHGAEQTPDHALGSAHDELATEHEPGTAHEVHIARLVPGVEILRSQCYALERVTEQACECLEEVLYDEVGGDDQLIDDLTPEQRQCIGRAILEIIAATGAIRGQGLDDDTAHEVTIE